MASPSLRRSHTPATLPAVCTQPARNAPGTDASPVGHLSFQADAPSASTSRRPSGLTRLGESFTMSAFLEARPCRFMPTVASPRSRQGRFAKNFRPCPDHLPRLRRRKLSETGDGCRFSTGRVQAGTPPTFGWLRGHGGTSHSGPSGCSQTGSAASGGSGGSTPCGGSCACHYSESQDGDNALQSA